MARGGFLKARARAQVRLTAHARRGERTLAGWGEEPFGQTVRDYLDTLGIAPEQQTLMLLVWRSTGFTLGEVVNMRVEDLDSANAQVAAPPRETWQIELPPELDGLRAQVTPQMRGDGIRDDE